MDTCRLPPPAARAAPTSIVEVRMEQRNTLRRVTVAASVALLAACQDSPTPFAPVSQEPALLARSQQAQERLEALFQATSPEVMAIPGTVFADNDEVAGRLVFGVEHIGAIRGVRNALARHGVAESEYSIELTQPIHAVKTLRDVFRPTVAGIQIHFTRYVCTMGFNVDHGGTRSFITNSHCTATQGGTEGTLYYQSSKTIDPTVIATEVHDPAYVKGGSCPKGKKCRYSDASRAAYSAGVASTRGEIAQTTGVNNGSLTVSTTAPVFTINAQDNTTTNFLNASVNKVGRTTGWTSGTVNRSCVNTSVSGSTVYLYCQSFVSNPSGATVVGSGDSGSPVFTGSGSTVTLVGILWGGSSDNKTFVFSPLASVQRELGSFNAVK
jgi:hypothetical protein